MFTFRHRGVGPINCRLEMGKLKASVPASILIESLVALGLFAMITTLLLGRIRRSRRAISGFQRGRGLICRSNGLWQGKITRRPMWYSAVQVEKDADQLSWSIIKGRWYCMWNNGKVMPYPARSLGHASLGAQWGVCCLSRFLDQVPACWIGLPGASKAGRMGTFSATIIWN